MSLLLQALQKAAKNRDDNTGKASALLFVASRVKNGVLRKPLGWRTNHWEVFVQFVTQ